MSNPRSSHRSNEAGLIISIQDGLQKLIASMKGMAEVGRGEHCVILQNSFPDSECEFQLTIGAAEGFAVGITSVGLNPFPAGIAHVVGSLRPKERLWASIPENAETKSAKSVIVWDISTTVRPPSVTKE